MASTVSSSASVPEAPSPTASVRLGLALGCAASLQWALFLAYSRRAALDGLLPQDIVFLRFAVAGLILLPLVLRAGSRDLGGVGWGRGLVLMVLAGPFYAAFNAGAFLWAPLSHGAIVQPATASLSGILIALLFLHERISRMQAAGIALVLFGLAVIGTAADGTAGPDAWIGDALFVVGGVMWGLFTATLRLWRLNGVMATAALSVLSLPIVLLAVPFFGMERLLALPADVLAMQVLVQGVFAGAVAVVCFAVAVQHLGAARASLFLAVVPPLALVVGIPVTGEVPSMTEWLGVAVAAAGLAVAVAATARG